MSGPELEPPALACLERTRSAVLNVLVAVGAGIALSGVFLSRREGAAPGWDRDLAERAAFGGLLALTVLGYAVRRIAGGRKALEDPGRRGPRFFRSHVASAGLAALAIPLGLAYAWAVRPQLDAVAPFWVAALALGVLALPRARELEGFDAPMPMPEPSEPPE